MRRSAARDIADGGWGKPRIRAFPFERCRRPLDLVKQRGSARGLIEPGDDTRLVPMVAAASDILVVAARGAGGRFSATIPCWGGSTASRAVTRRIPPPEVPR